MSGSRTLRACMLGLVLVNLVFVQLTGAARFEWLAPLYALTLAAPFLKGLRENLVYRSLWNLGVIAVLAVLLKHASGYDLQYVLQDGLVLAGLCQVHLLNNLRADQRPDLLFWNSFLIAVATAYLSQDLAFAFAFLIYAPLYVVGLQLLCVTRQGRELGRGPTGRVVRDGLARSAVLLAATLVVFLFWPRDFHRSSFLSGDFDFGPGEAPQEVAFTAGLKLDKGGPTVASARVVMTVTLESGSPAAGSDQRPTSSLWRGATLAKTDGQSWWPLNSSELARTATGDYWWLNGAGGFQRGGGGDPAGPTLAVVNVDPQANHLFTPLDARGIVFGSGVDRHIVAARRDATIRYGVMVDERPPVHYRLTLERPGPSRLQGPLTRSSGEAMPRYVALPASPRVRSARELAAEIAGDLTRELADGRSAEVQQHELVAAFSDYLEDRYTYLPPGADGAAQSLDEFLAGDAGGHCEFFASALATMLRSRGVPCRVATGYRASEWDPTGRRLTIRRKDAHAWVEVFDPSGGWYAVDPNPSSAAAAVPGLLARVSEAVRRAWSSVAGFDAERRGAVLAWSRALPGRAWAGIRAHPWSTTLGALAALLAWAGLRRLRTRGISPSVRRYRRAVRRAGLSLVPGETPRELIDRARRAGVLAARVTALREATVEHERARYAG